MKLGATCVRFGVMSMTIVWLAGVLVAGGQAPPPDKQPLAEEVFKNIRVLRGLPVDELIKKIEEF